MQVRRLKDSRNIAFPALPAGVRTIIEMAADRTGATIIDYALLAGLVAMAAVTGFQQTGAAVTGLFDTISTVFAASMPPST